MTGSEYPQSDHSVTREAATEEELEELGEVFVLRPPPRWRARRRLYKYQDPGKIYGQVHRLVTRDQRLTMTARVVYAELASYAWVPDRRGLAGWVRAVPVEQIAVNLGCSQSTIRAAVDSLEALGWVQREDARGPERTVTYRLPLLSVRNGLDLELD
jgi:DNA-binding MarR family transcriptional regulator